MPKGNRTGPMGEGPRSGRASVYCANYDAPGFKRRFFGQGSGAGFARNWGEGGRGGRRGWRNMFWRTGLHRGLRLRNEHGRQAGRLAGLPGWGWFGRNFSEQPNPDAGAEKKAIENQVDFLKSQLDQLQKRLSVLEATDADR
jgi:hypothetical protein